MGPLDLALLRPAPRPSPALTCAPRAAPPLPLQWEGDGDGGDGEAGSSKTIDFVYDPDSDTPGGWPAPGLNGCWAG